jgi:two-component system chemotaxis response regulator CheY
MKRAAVSSAHAAVLIVEDEPALQESLRRALQHAGFETEAAFDCRKAIERLAGPPLDVVCIDLCLPDQSGYELCEYIRRTPATADVPIVFMGDGAFPEHMVHAEMAGANAFLEKPFHVDALVRCIESLLDRAPASTTKTHVLRMP